MIVHVITCGYLGKYTQRYASVASIEIQEKAKVKELIAYLGLPEEESFIVAVNGQIVAFSHVLNQDDQVRLIPPISGG